MLYIWSDLKRYPKWLVLDFVAAIFFVIVNLGLPTVLARMIDEGINPKQTDRLFFWAWVMFGVIILGVLGRIVLAYAAGKLTTTMVQDMRNDLYAKLQEYSHHEYGCHYSLDDAVQYSHDFSDQPISSLDCSCFSAFLGCRGHLCGG